MTQEYTALVREAQAQVVTLEADRDGDLVVADLLARLEHAVEDLATKLDAVRKYADERAWYGRRNRTVDSVRIASDLFHILGLGPDGKVSDGQQ